jgi:hypothetical protein
VRGRAGMQCIQSKIRPFVHQTTMFGTLGLQFDLHRFCQKQITGHALSRQFCCDSVTVPRADNAVRAAETQKSQNRQCSDKHKGHHEGLLPYPV